MEKYSKYVSGDFAKIFYDREDPKLKYREGMTPEEHDIWKQKVTAKMRELMAFSEDLYEMPRVNLLLSKQRGSYRIEKYEISPEPNLWMTFLMMIPNEASNENKLPVVLCCPNRRGEKEHLCGEEFCDLDHDFTPAQNREPRRYIFSNMQALHYCNSGMIAIACEDMCVGEHACEVDDEDIYKMLMNVGRHMMGITVEVRFSIMKWVKTLPFVDCERLAVSANSHGVDSALYVALLDKDIKAFLYNDGLHDWKSMISATCPPERVDASYWRGYDGVPVIASPKFLLPYSQMYPGKWEWYTQTDLLAAYAPRKLYITEGGRTEDLERLAKVYEACGTPDHFQYDYLPEYRDPATRKHDHSPLPKMMTTEEYWEYCNMIPKKNFFKYLTAVPWMIEALK